MQEYSNPPSSLAKRPGSTPPSPRSSGRAGGTCPQNGCPCSDGIQPWAPWSLCPPSLRAPSPLPPQQPSSSLQPSCFILTEMFQNSCVLHTSCMKALLPLKNKPMLRALNRKNSFSLVCFPLYSFSKAFQDATIYKSNIITRFAFYSIKNQHVTEVK